MKIKLSKTDWKQIGQKMGWIKSAGEELIRIMCPNLECQRVMLVPSSARGEIVRCRGCDSKLRISANRPSVSDGTAAVTEEKGTKNENQTI
jgi:hypothetical protein